MNINVFFISLSIGLLMIFFLFKPLNLKQQSFVDIPLFELNGFTLHEMNREGLVTFMNGREAIRYSDRYVVNDINYTDNSKKYIANMKAKHGIYKDDVINLDGEIIYVREDGLTFRTNSAQYDKQTHIVRADGKYVSYRGSNVISGDALKYNNLLDTAESKNVSVTYKLGDKI